MLHKLLLSMDPVPSSGSREQRARHRHHSAGKAFSCKLQVKVFWPAMGRWYIGRVSAFDGKTGRHTVQFKDGDKREYTLRHEAVVWLDVPGLDRASRLEHGWHADEVRAPRQISLTCRVLSICSTQLAPYNRMYWLHQSS